MVWAAFAAATIVALSVLWRSGEWLVHADGSVWAQDYLAQWAAGRRLWDGRAPLVYNWHAHELYQARLIGVAAPVKLYIFYPPPFLFTTLAFAKLNFLPATLAFLTVTVGAYAASLRLLLRSWSSAILVALSGGGAFYCLWYTQNGFLTAALITAALALLTKRPIFAGLLIGCLTIKPQLGLLMPVALVAGGHWRTIIAAVITTVALAIAAEILIGPGIWIAFIGSLRDTVGFLDSGNLWFKQQSVFSLAQPFVGPPGAWLCYAIVASIVTIIVTAMWRSPNVDQRVKSSALISGGLLVTPYLYSYDAVGLSAAAVMLLDRRNSTAQPWPERVAVFAACLMPIASRYLLSAAVPIAALIMLYLAVRQAGRATGSASAMIVQGDLSANLGTHSVG